jgi:hypothetical protein
MQPAVALALVAQLVGVTAELLPMAEVEAAPQSPTTVDTQPPVRFDVTRFDTLTAFNLQQFLDSVSTKGIPTAPLINRALEGAARRVNGKLIMQVVRSLAIALGQARDALGPSSPVDELEAGAGAIRAGIDVGTLADLRAARPAAGTATIPLVVLTDVVERGVPKAGRAECGHNDRQDAEVGRSPEWTAEHGRQVLRSRGRVWPRMR